MALAGHTPAINGAGSNALIRREIDEDVLKICRPIVVVRSRTAPRPAIYCPCSRRAFERRTWSNWATSLSGQHPGRRSPEDITLFESQGMAEQDISLAVRLEALAREKGMGVGLPFGG